LFYHLLRRDNLPVYAVSLLKEAPAAISSKTVLGWLPAAAAAASAESGNTVEEHQAGLYDFVQNDSFIDILHSSIRNALEKGRDESVRSEAVQRESGWLHINDARNIPPIGRIGDPDDIIGSVLVENGQVIPSTYQRMPSYRICTSDGPTQLSEGLLQELLDDLNSIHESETSTSS